jgi:hypothetical protein
MKHQNTTTGIIGLLLLLLIFSAIPSGCGGGGSNDTPYNNNTSPTSGYTVSGTLTDSTTGAPVSGASCSLNQEAKQVKAYATATTDSSGRYSFSGVPAGNYSVLCTATNYVGVSQYISVSANTTNVSPSIPSVSAWNTAMGDANHPYDANSGYILVNIRDYSGKALSGASVFISPVSYGQHGATNATGTGFEWDSYVTTSAGGVFFYKVTPGSSYTIEASKPGYTFTSLKGVVSTAGIISSYAMTAASGGQTPTYSITGQLFNKDATPIAGGSVTAISQTASTTTNTDANGNYTFPALPMAIYTLRFSASGMIPDNIMEINLMENCQQNCRLFTEIEFNALLGSAHPYDASSGYLMVNLYASESGFSIEGAVISLTPATYSALGYTNVGEVIDWTATTTYHPGSAIFYRVTPGNNYTITASKQGYSFTPVYNGFSKAGEITEYLMSGYGGGTPTPCPSSSCSGSAGTPQGKQKIATSFLLMLGLSLVILRKDIFTWFRKND